MIVFLVKQMILQWVEQDESRKEHLITLLRQIRFQIMDLDDLEEIPKEILEIKEIREEVSPWGCIQIVVLTRRLLVE